MQNVISVAMLSEGWDTVNLTHIMGLRAFTSQLLCEKVPQVVAWAKNDHLDFVIRYLWRGSSRNFVPDYLIRLNNGKTLVLEVKGVDDERNRMKRTAMAVWIKTVNEQGGFGQWCFDVVFEPARTRDVLLKHASECKSGE